MGPGAEGRNSENRLKTSRDRPDPAELSATFGPDDPGMQRLTDQLPAVVWTADGDLRVTAVSGGALRTLAEAQALAEGCDLSGLFPDADAAARVREACRKALAGESAACKAEWFGRPFEHRLEPHRDADGEIVGVLGLSVPLAGPGAEPAAPDATPHLEDERAIADAIFDASGAYLVVLTTEGRIAKMNPACAHAMGYAPEEVQGRALWDVIQSEAEERERKQAHFAALAGMQCDEAERRFPREIQRGWRTRDGKVRQIVWTTTYHPAPDGSVRFVIASGIDVTGRRDAEQRLAGSEARLRAILDAEPECVKVLSADARLIAMNPAGLKIIEAEQAEDVVGESVVNLVAASYRKPFLEHVEAVFRGESRSLEFEMVGLRGTRRWMESRSVPLWDESEPGRVQHLLAVSRDITERKRAEQALADNAHRLKEAQRIAALGTWEWTLGTDEMHWSNEVYRLLGEEPGASEPGMQRFFAAIHPEDRNRMATVRTSARAGDKVGLQTFRVVGADGRERWAQAMGEFVRDENGRPVRVIGAIQDITERKETERALAESKSRLEQAQRIAHMGSWTWDIPSGALTWTDEIFRIFGFAPGEVAPTYDEFMARIHPDDRQSVRDAVDAALAGERPYAVEHRLMWPDGTVRHVLEQGELSRDGNGEPVGMVGIVLDITEREEARRALERERTFNAAILESTPALVVVRDSQGRIVRFNRAAAELAGYSQDEMLGSNAWDLLATDEQREEVRRRFEVLATLTCEEATARYGEAMERFWRTRDGRLRRIALTLSFLPDADGRVAFQVATGLDITERRAAEEALRESEARLRVIANAVPVSLSYFDTDLRWRFAVRETGEWMQRDPKDMAGRHLSEVMGQQFFERARPRMERALAGERVEVQTVIDYPDGKTRHVETLHIPDVDETGRVRGIITMVQDVTRRKAAEDGLRQLNETLEQRVRERTAELAEERNFIATVLDTQEALVVVLDRNGAIVRFNRACEALTGYVAAEVLGRRVWDFLIPTEHAPQVERLFEEISAGDFPNRYENPWIDRHGNPVLIAWSNSAILDEAGTVAYVIATGIDVTQQRRAEDAMRVQVQVLDQVRGVVATTDTDGYVNSWNRQAELYLGYSRQEAIGRHISFLYPPDSSQLGETMALLRNHGEALVEQTLHTRAREPRSVLLSLGFLRDDQGEPAGVVGFAVDNAERKRAEEELAAARARLSFLLTSSPAMIYAARAGQAFSATFVSDNVRRVTGYAPEQFTSDSEFWFRNLHEEDRQRVLDTLSNLERDADLALEYRFRVANGSYRWFRDQCRLVRDSEGRPLEVVGVWIDVTAQVEAEQRVTRMQEQLAVQQKMATVGQITATVSHELRNPLGTIRTSVFSLKERLAAGNAGDVRTLERIERNVVRCDNIINDLLDFSRTRTSSPEPTDIGPWLRELVDELTKPDWLRVELELALDGVVVALDQDRLRRAVINVVDNAVQAVQHSQANVDPPDGCLRVAACVEGEPAAERLVIRVRDTGPGIEPEVRGRIFEPLFSTKTYGVGLGLPTVQQILEQERGGVEIASAPGEGTEVTLWLPLAGRMQGVA